MPCHRFQRGLLHERISVGRRILEQSAQPVASQQLSCGLPASDTCNSFLCLPLRNKTGLGLQWTFHCCVMSALCALLLRETMLTHLAAADAVFPPDCRGQGLQGQGQQGREVRRQVLSVASIERGGKVAGVRRAGPSYVG